MVGWANKFAGNLPTKPKKNQTNKQHKKDYEAFRIIFFSVSTSKRRKKKKRDEINIKEIKTIITTVKQY